MRVGPGPVDPAGDDRVDHAGRARIELQHAGVAGVGEFAFRPIGDRHRRGARLPAAIIAETVIVSVNHGMSRFQVQYARLRPSKQAISACYAYTESAATAVTLNVASVNDPPVAQANAYSVNEDATLTVSAPGVLANDTDVENDALTAVLVAGPAHAASFTLNANGSFSYTPAPNYFGADSFTYHAQDSHDAYSSVVAVTLTVQSVNDPPVAHADAYTHQHRDDADSCRARSPSRMTPIPTTTRWPPRWSHGPAHAAANGFTLNANGSFSYTPAPTYLGTDSFTYQVSDGHGGTATTVVTITVHANTDPTAVDDACTVAKDSTANALAVLANDIDPDNDILTVASVSLALHGTTAVSTGSPGTPSTPRRRTSSARTCFRYQVSDGHAGTAWATVWVTVENTTNDTPHAYPMTVHTYEDIAISIRLLADDYDGDGTDLQHHGAAGPRHG